MPKINEFELQVKLTGICMFGIRKSTQSIVVVMPDTRFERDAAGTEIPMRHPDGTEAVPHVGYLRFNLANLVPPMGNEPPADLENVPQYEVPATNVTAAPPYEVVHRFDRAELVFEIGADGEDITKREHLLLPNFDKFASDLEPIPDVFDSNNKPPDVVLMRTVLTGGQIGSVAEGEEWILDGDSRPGGSRVRGSFDGDILWRRRVSGDRLTLTIKPFDTTAAPVSITLRPTWINGAPSIDGELPIIPLKIANLCSTNPMEWDELELRRVREADVDFKWFYRLLQPKSGNGSVAFQPAKGSGPDARPIIPHPQPVRISEAREGILTDCFPGRIGVPH